jgi:hypothetical protein
MGPPNMQTRPTRPKVIAVAALATFGFPGRRRRVLVGY